MNISITYKLFLTLLLAISLIVVGTLVFMHWSVERGFIGFVEARQQERIESLASRLAEVYAQDNGWRQLQKDKQRWVHLLMEGRRPSSGHKIPHWARHGLKDRSSDWPPFRRGLRASKRHHLPMELRVMLLDAKRQVVYGRAEHVAELALYDISLDGRTVGYLGVLPGPALGQLGEVVFLKRQTDSFLVVALATVVLSVALAWLLTHRLVRPLRAFSTALRNLAVGDYDTRLDMVAGDELGRMATDINELALTLQKTERLRREWVADISHELRTPLTVLKGELEAVQDGIRPLDAGSVDSLCTEVGHLQRLVDDLYELSMSDLGTLTYRKQESDPVGLLRDYLEGLAGEFSDKEISTELIDDTSTHVRIQADADRLSQLFRNLLHNSVRYTDAGGQLRITISDAGERLIIDLEDSAPGVAQSDLPHLFERLYRVEASRSRASGGAGLGLAICRNIVEAHGGGISARASELGGLCVRVELPILPI